jgi:hypothetical protein
MLFLTIFFLIKKFFLVNLLSIFSLKNYIYITSGFYNANFAIFYPIFCGIIDQFNITGINSIFINFFYIHPLIFIFCFFKWIAVLFFTIFPDLPSSINPGINILFPYTPTPIDTCFPGQAFGLPMWLNELTALNANINNILYNVDAIRIFCTINSPTKLMQVEAIPGILPSLSELITYNNLLENQVVSRINRSDTINFLINQYMQEYYSNLHNTPKFIYVKGFILTFIFIEIMNTLMWSTLFSYFNLIN